MNLPAGNDWDLPASYQVVNPFMIPFDDLDELPAEEGSQIAHVCLDELEKKRKTVWDKFLLTSRTKLSPSDYRKYAEKNDIDLSIPVKFKNPSTGIYYFKVLIPDVKRNCKWLTVHDDEDDLEDWK